MERDGRNIYYGRKRRYGGILICLNFILLVIEILICIGEENAEKVWINDISSAIVMTKKQWKEFVKANGIKEESVQLYERRYTND